MANVAIVPTAHAPALATGRGVWHFKHYWNMTRISSISAIRSLTSTKSSDAWRGTTGCALPSQVARKQMSTKIVIEVAHAADGTGGTTQPSHSKAPRGCHVEAHLKSF